MDNPKEEEEEEQCSFVFSGRVGAFVLNKNPKKEKFWLLVQGCHINDVTLLTGTISGEQQQRYPMEGKGHRGGPDDNLIEGGGSKFVCKPGARNITIIFHPLLRLSPFPTSLSFSWLSKPFPALFPSLDTLQPLQVPPVPALDTQSDPKLDTALSRASTKCRNTKFNTGNMERTLKIIEFHHGQGTFH
ncbi:hypothetical protein TURU_081952 [Turdus rufiventris]|nr:hypothetical protein TURU_081952 [Turdus rufiventris]